MLSRSFISRRALASAPIRSFQTSRILLAGKEDALRKFRHPLARFSIIHPHTLFVHPWNHARVANKEVLRLDVSNG